eukprot:5429522-Pyramimonas_sp.AAC.1
MRVSHVQERTCLKGAGLFRGLVRPCPFERVERVQDSCLSPHYPVALRLRSHLVRTEYLAMAGPRRFPAQAPQLPLPAPPDWGPIEE